MKQYAPLLLLLLVILPFLFTSATQAQVGISTCAAYIEDALQTLDDVCTDVGRNTACYGHSLIQAELQIEAIDDFSTVRFAMPSDTLELPFLASLRTAPLNIDEDVWGIAVMNTQANLPGTLPGQGVVMLVLGDTEITNGVSPDNVFESVLPIPAQVNTQGARIRSGAGLAFSVNVVAQQGDTVEIDARNEVGDWLRVVYGDTGGWIFTDLVNITQPQLDTLPVLDDILQTPMQTFYFTTGIGNPECQQAPDAVLIQSPRGVSASLTINESEITLSSTILLETDGSQMILTVIDGEAQVNNLIVPEGYKAFIDTNQDTQIVQDLGARGISPVQSQQLPASSGQWRSCTPLTSTDRERLAQLPNIPASLLNYSIQLPGQPTQFCASPEELAALQQQADATDVPTAEPTADTTAAPAVTVEVTTEVLPTDPVVAGEYDCTPFRLASPREGMAFGNQIFYWDPTNPAAASYEIFVYDNGGNIVAQATTSATQITLDTGDRNPTGGVYYSWTVQARDANGNVVCGPLPPAVQLREAAPQPTAPPPLEEDEDDDDDDIYTPPEDTQTCDVVALEEDAKASCPYGYDLDVEACSFQCYLG